MKSLAQHIEIEVSRVRSNHDDISGGCERSGPLIVGTREPEMTFEAEAFRVRVGGKLTEKKGKKAFESDQFPLGYHVECDPQVPLKAKHLTRRHHMHTYNQLFYFKANHPFLSLFFSLSPPQCLSHSIPLQATDFQTQTRELTSLSTPWTFP